MPSHFRSFQISQKYILCPCPKLYSWVGCIHIVLHVIRTNPLHLLYDRHFAVLIINTKIVLTINNKDASACRFPQPHQHFVWHCLILMSCCLNVWAIEAIFVFFSLSVLILIHYHVPTALSSLFPCCSCAAVLVPCLVVYRDYWSSAFYCSAIFDCNLISELPVWLHVFLYLWFG